RRLSTRYARSPSAARRCRRRARTSIRSCPRVCSSCRLTDWLETCRRAVEDVRLVLEELPTRTEREPVVGDGVGGDETTAIDAAAERVVVARLEQEQPGFALVSEELGTRPGRDGVVVVLDPIDG